MREWTILFRFFPDEPSFSIFLRGNNSPWRALIHMIEDGKMVGQNRKDLRLTKQVKRHSNQIRLSATYSLRHIPQMCECVCVCFFLYVASYMYIQYFGQHEELQPNLMPDMWKVYVVCFDGKSFGHSVPFGLLILILSALLLLHSFCCCRPTVLCWGSDSKPLLLFVGCRWWFGCYGCWCYCWYECY